MRESRGNGGKETGGESKKVGTRNEGIKNTGEGKSEELQKVMDKERGVSG